MKLFLFLRLSAWGFISKECVTVTFKENMNPEGVRRISDDKGIQTSHRPVGTERIQQLRYSPLVHRSQRALFLKLRIATMLRKALHYPLRLTPHTHTSSHILASFYSSEMTS